MKTIVVTLFRRPEMTRKLLDALGRCYGIEDYAVLFSCDWDPAYADQCNQVLALVKQWMVQHPNAGSMWWQHCPRLGIDVNKLFVWPIAFKYSDFVIGFEDDTIPARDALRYFEWANERFRDDLTIFSVSGYQRTGADYQADPRNHYAVISNQNFNCWGYGTWKNRWEQVVGDESAYRSWAGNLVNGRFDFWWQKWGADRGLRIVAPVIARVQNLVGLAGDEKGQNANDPHATDNFNAHGAWEIPGLPDPHPDVWRLI